MTEEEQEIIRLFANAFNPAGAPSAAQGVTSLVASVAGLFEFPRRAVLLWSGCKRQGFEYSCPAGLRDKLKRAGFGALDRRMNNGPPNSAFKLGGGFKPKRWELDHIYDEAPMWSVTHDGHFTQSAGLVAMQRYAHLRRHSNIKLTWLVRGIAFVKFGYDPLSVFSPEPHDRFGFVEGSHYEVFWPEPCPDSLG
jgi:hypothetical protein